MPPSIIGHILASINPAVLFASILSPAMEESMKEMTQVKFPIWIGYLIFYSIHYGAFIMA